ncbi:UDP-glucose/GDP-mannose dehydrogenase family protein [Ramlibacter sp. 2FC]|uniref:UDP-glucose dehydrogenase family protein n=1 Tax=Ramlibacter sp. 2FC TaxID=2502188 RepID=UPI0010F757E4|nr:UDP-glucose/GDP-mannose dehydrogenase family protein [Ramlibacter sp. 2FC]
MNVIVVGTGYVGLVTGACLASKGNRVICVDKDQIKLDKLKDGVLPIYEPGLDVVVHDAVAAGHLSFANRLSQALTDLPPPAHDDQRTLIFIAVGTPQGEDGSADLKYVQAVAREIGQELKQPAIVINKSTVPVGTADVVKGEIAWQLFQRKTFIDFEVASNPEFLKEGAALDDFFNPDRIVVGTESPAARTQLSALYEPFVSRPEQLMIVGVKEAELIKYASNAMLATRISFMNEIANVCDRFGIDVEQVRGGVGADSRIGPAFLKPGCGYGGSCFPKDVQALVRIAQSVGVEPFVLNAVEARNKKQKQHMFQNIAVRLGNNLHGRQFAVWGLAFKPETDDMREASSIELIRALVGAGAKVVAHDPVAGEMAGTVFADLIHDGQLRIANDAMDALEGADALALVTEWGEYKAADFAAVKASLKQPLVFDGRNHLPMTDLKALGFEYVGVGRR